MTVEASLLLPLFLMLFMNLLSVIEIYRIHSSVAETLWKGGRETAQYYYLNDAVGEMAGISEEADSHLAGLMASLSGNRQIVKSLGNYPIWEKIVADGKSGFTVYGEIDKKGFISVYCGYGVHPMFFSLTPVSKKVQNQYYGHAWTGYKLGGENDREEQGDVYVYITETGTVYHRNRECSYLNPSIQRVPVSGVGELRNRSGAKYYACPFCDDKKSDIDCYITDYGTNYHTSIACSGLKRTVYTVKLSEVGGRGACSKCGG